MNKQQANELYHQAELIKILDSVKSLAQDAKQSGRFRITSKKTVESLNKLGFNCGYVDDVDGVEIWQIDWSD